MKPVDLNCDLGELPELAADGTDAALMEWITSANVACGGHAGDEASMAATVACATRLGVAVGAHPSFRDGAFGRRETTLAPDAIEALVREQVEALVCVAGRLGTRLSHVKPHGALYHAAGRDRDVAAAIARAVEAAAPGVVIVGFAGSPMLDVWREAGFRVAGEAFADRRYAPDGSLVPRSDARALIFDPAEAAAQAVGLAATADTLCVHSDTAGAVAIVRAVREALEAAGVPVRSFDRIGPVP